MGSWFTRENLLLGIAALSITLAVTHMNCHSEPRRRLPSLHDKIRQLERRVCQRLDVRYDHKGDNLQFGDARPDLRFPKYGLKLAKQALAITKKTNVKDSGFSRSDLIAKRKQLESLVVSLDFAVMDAEMGKALKRCSKKLAVAKKQINAEAKRLGVAGIN